MVLKHKIQLGTKIIDITDEDEETTSKAEPISYREPDVTDVVQPTELGEAIQHLIKDELNKEGMSSMDMLSQLKDFEASGILAIDALVALRFLPKSCLHITRQKKRISPSINGERAKQIVAMVASKREHDADKGNMGIAQRISKGLTG